MYGALKKRKGKLCAHNLTWFLHEYIALYFVVIICMCEYILRHKGVDLLFGLILISDIHRVIELYQCYCVCCVLNKCHKGVLSVLPS